MSYEIARSTNSNQRYIRRSTAEPDGRLTFAGFREAKQALQDLLEMDIFHAREIMLSLKANQEAVRRLRKKDADALQQS